ncbi:hypothetical protein [Streptomyces antimicrobicus]|uniref:Uncharacterized protein n=1 Tax=Streptomyces antimicrobicus TaxID=2883108 RepID=A0ABS8B379_9ACTN|nr:hypothetical protein [Streptomyces antimicrobicus]MCB5179042.1 hypothetical protein [Streptomyces antimicrobicus]
MRLARSASERDVGALKAWLERERKLEALRNNGELEIHEGASAEDARGPGTPMGAGFDIMLVLIGAAAPKVFDEVYAQVKSGVQAWRENRRSVESGEPPEVDVTPEGDGR